MGCIFDGRIRCCTIIFYPTPIKTLVGFDLIMHKGTTRQRCRHVHNRWKLFNLCHNRICSIAGLFNGFCNHRSISIPHMAHFAMRQNRALGLFHGFTIAAGNRPSCRIPTHFSKIFTRKNRQNPWHGCGGGCIDRFDRTMRHITAQKHSMRLINQVNI